MTRDEADKWLRREVPVDAEPALSDEDVGALLDEAAPLGYALSAMERAAVRALGWKVARSAEYEGDETAIHKQWIDVLNRRTSEVSPASAVVKASPAKTASVLI